MNRTRVGTSLKVIDRIGWSGTVRERHDLEFILQAMGTHEMP